MVKATRAFVKFVWGGGLSDYMIMGDYLNFVVKKKIAWFFIKIGCNSLGYNIICDKKV